MSRLLLQDGDERGWLAARQHLRRRARRRTLSRPPSRSGRGRRASCLKKSSHDVPGVCLQLALEVGDAQDAKLILVDRRARMKSRKACVAEALLDHADDREPLS